MDNSGRDRDDSCNEDPFNLCHSMRLKLLNAFPSSEWGDHLEKYGELVDSHDQRQVNNYSAATLDLISGLETDRSRWQTSLSDKAAEKWLADLGIKTCAPEELTSSRIHAMIPGNKRESMVQVQPENIPPSRDRSRVTPEESTGARVLATIPNNKPATSVVQGQPESVKPPLILRSRAQSEEYLSELKMNSSVRSQGLSVTLRLPKAGADCQKFPESETPEKPDARSMFLTGNDELRRQRQQRGAPATAEPPRKCLGPRRHGGFVPPFVKDVATGSNGGPPMKRGRPSEEVILAGNEEEMDERLVNIDPKMVEMIRGEIMSECRTTWDDVAGLEYAKASIQEMVVWPLLRPDLFTGLRAPPRGLLLFGPPGTGKTLLGRCIAAHAQATFFCVSAATLTSKWVGDGEKMVRALFAVARCQQPAVVFIDEIDSILTQRSDTEHESSRRLKTEFLVQLDGAGVSGAERVLIVGATNRPQELDEAARRRLVKRLYIPLPDEPARRQLVARLLSGEKNCLSESDLAEVAARTDGFSGADLRAACAEAALGPVRELGASMQSARPDQVRPVSLVDFVVALTRVKPSVAPGDLDAYVAWDKTFGCGS